MTDNLPVLREALPYVGFSKLRPGRIHIYCPGCGRKASNGYRDDGDEFRPADPPNAVLAHIYCERCSSGCKDAPVTFWDAFGKRIHEAWEDGQ
jgi:hypothetical protein